jgi:hypothetical protein
VLSSKADDIGEPNRIIPPAAAAGQPEPDRTDTSVDPLIQD